MPSVAEISHFKASEDYKPGSASLDATLVQINKAAGLKRSYVGYQTEDPLTVFWVNDWITKDARDSHAMDKPYPALGTVNYVEFEDAEGALGAPITEFVTFTLKEGNAIDQLEPLVQELHRLLAGTPLFHGDSWGRIIGRTDAYHGILGWDSVEAHWKAVGGGPLKEVIDRVKEIADLWLVHAALRGFPA